MKLADLNPVYISFPTRSEEGNWTYSRIAVEEVDGDPAGLGGIEFDCPQCKLVPEQDEYLRNSKGRFWHRPLLYVPDAFDCDPRIGPGRWSMVGTGIHDLSLVAGSSSVRCHAPCAAHFFVKDGEIEMCSDSGTDELREVIGINRLPPVGEEDDEPEDIYWPASRDGDDGE